MLRYNALASFTEKGAYDVKDTVDWDGKYEVQGYGKEGRRDLERPVLDVELDGYRNKAE